VYPRRQRLPAQQAAELRETEATLIARLPISSYLQSLPALQATELRRDRRCTDCGFRFFNLQSLTTWQVAEPRDSFPVVRPTRTI
jgi:hypothetical protein